MPARETRSQGLSQPQPGSWAAKASAGAQRSAIRRARKERGPGGCSDAFLGGGARPEGGVVIGPLAPQLVHVLFGQLGLGGAGVAVEDLLVAPAGLVRAAGMQGSGFV